jgi:hypothetical protein
MRSLAALLIVELLSFLLVVTSPTGTGEGVHHDQLLDVLFPHVHLVDGRVVSADTARPSLEHASGAPVLGAGTGASAVAGAGIVPPATTSITMPPLAVVGRLGSSDELLPTGYLEAPPDPPPTSTAG